MLEELGIKGVINATGSLTVLGGSVLDDEVLGAIREASKVYLDMPNLHEKVGIFVAGLTGAEDAYVTCGGAAGLALAAGACITRGDTGAMSMLPRTAGMRNQIIIQRQHRNQYDNALEIAGASLVEVGTAEGCRAEDLRCAMTDETCAVVYFAYDPQPGVLPLGEVIQAAGERQIPVIVDAAAELPPPNNLRKYLRMGADLVIFSGGKDIGAPNDTGVILGRRDLVRTCRRLGPHSYEMVGPRTRTYLGRPMKTSKEDILAFAVALRRYLQVTDHRQRMEGWERKVDLLTLGALDHRLSRKEAGAGVRQQAAAPGDNPEGRDPDARKAQGGPGDSPGVACGRSPDCRLSHRGEPLHQSAVPEGRRRRGHCR